MPPYSFDWVDAFTETPFGGNACAVVHDAADLAVEDRLALVRETSLSECAYLVGSDTADFGARYYLATREILMAGHPTIATIASLIHRGLVTPTPEGTAFTLEVGAADARFEFSEPNPVRLDRFSVDAGASSVEAHATPAIRMIGRSSTAPRRRRT